MENKLWKNYASIFFILIVCIFISRDLKLTGDHDDLFFSTVFHSKTLLEFLEWRYYTWTGRIPIEGLMVLTINHPWYWKIIIPVSTVAIAASISILAGYKKDSVIYITSFVLGAMLLLINYNVIKDAMWWVTGSYNYLQPIAAGLVSIVIHSRKNNFGYILKTISLFLVMFSCFNEQFLIMVLIPYVILYTIFQKDYSSYNLFYLIVVFIFLVFTLTAPGNQERLAAEVRWIPDYVNLGLIEKITLGFDKLSSHISNENILFNFFIVFIFYLAIQKREFSFPSLIAIFILLLKIITFFLFMSKLSVINILNNPNILDFGQIARLSTFIPYIYSLLVLFSCIQIISSLCKDNSDLIIWIIPFILAIGSVVMLGMSPTVYTPGFRVLFVFDLLIIFIFTSMIKRLI